MSFLNEVVDMTISAHDLSAGIRMGIIDAAKKEMTEYAPECIGEADKHWLLQNGFQIVDRNGAKRISWSHAVQQKRKKPSSEMSVSTPQ
jgi:hypothetical protein